MGKRTVNGKVKKQLEAFILNEYGFLYLEFFKCQKRSFQEELIYELEKELFLKSNDISIIFKGSDD